MNMFFFTAFFWYIDFFFIFIPKTLMSLELFFSILWMFLIFTGKRMSFKSVFLANSLSVSVILAGLRSGRFKYLTVLLLKHSLSSIFWILINHFLGWSNSFDDFKQLLPAKWLYLEILIIYDQLLNQYCNLNLFLKIFVCLL